MAGFELGEGLRKIFLVGVGAVATGAEKSKDIIDELVKKGELTVDQGKQLNSELSRKLGDAANDTKDALLRAQLSAMSPKGRAAYLKHLNDIAKDLDGEGSGTVVDSEAVDVDNGPLHQSAPAAADAADDGDKAAAAPAEGDAAAPKHADPSEDDSADKD